MTTLIRIKYLSIITNWNHIFSEFDIQNLSNNITDI